MKVILKEEIDGLGSMGQAVTVKDGYARNFLIPRGMAIVANLKNTRAMDHELRCIQQRAEKLKRGAMSLSDRIAALTVTIAAKAGEEQKLFGSVTNKDIAEALASEGLEIDRKKIALEEPIKRLGEHSVKVKLGYEVSARLKVVVVAEEGSETAPAQETPAA